jgi:hypothetical protein
MLIDRAQARTIVAPVLHPPQAIDQPLSDRRTADDAYDTAHVR